MENELVGKVEEVVVKVGDVVDRVAGTLDRVEGQCATKPESNGIEDELKAQKVQQQIADVFEEKKAFKESMKGKISELKNAGNLVWLGIVRYTEMDTNSQGDVLVQSLLVPETMSVKLQESIREIMMEEGKRIPMYGKVEEIRFLEFKDFGNLAIRGGSCYSILPGDEDKRSLPTGFHTVRESSFIEVFESESFKEKLDEDELNFVRFMTELRNMYLEQAEVLVHKIKLEGVTVPTDFVERNENMTNEELIRALYYYDTILTRNYMY